MEMRKDMYLHVCICVVVIILQSTISNAGQQCLSCSNVESAQNCQHHIFCSNTEVCYKHKYITESGGINYDFGCAQPEIIQRRINGFVDFYRGWLSYKEGFGNASSEYWLGNDKIHEITSHSNHDLRIELKDFDGNMKYAEYSTFSVGDEQSGYRLLASNYSGNAGDSLVRHNGMKFTTFDRDNDPYTDNCAVKYKGAWWYYSGCHNSNLNGKYLAGHHASVGEGIDWDSFKGFYYSLK